MLQTPTTVATARQQVGELARLRQLLSVLSPGPEWMAEPRRFYCLKDLLNGDLECSMSDGGQTVEQARTMLLGRSRQLPPAAVLPSLRAMAILHWEWAADSPAAKRASREASSCYEFATFLWRHVLTDQAFWQSFAEDHQVEKQHREEVRRRIVDDILVHHLEKAKQHQASKQEEASRFHLRCLEGWAEAPPACAADGCRPGTQFSEELGKEIQARADALINGWVSTFLQAAASQLKDPQALQSLPQGISRNFEGALGVVKQALDVMPDNLRLLSFAVRQYNDYSYELAIANRRDEARKVVAIGYHLALHLGETHLKEGDALNPENQVVYLACHLAYQLESETDKEMACLEECRRWGGSNEELELQILRQRARQAIEQEEYDEALRILDSADPRNAEKPEIVQLRAVCYFRRGFAVAECAGKMGAQVASSPKCFLDAWQKRSKDNLETMEGLYGQSVQDMRQAAELDPGQEVIRKNIRQIEEARHESRYHIILNVAHKVLMEEDEGHYHGMIEPLESVPPQAGSGVHARNFLSAIHFRLAVNAANAGDFALGEAHMLAAAELDPQDAVVEKQFVELYVAWGVSFVAQARKLYAPLEASPEAFLQEDRRRFKDLQPAAARLFAQAQQKFRIALERAPADDRILQVADEIRDPKCLYWGALLGAAHAALEKDQHVYYERLGALLRECPKGHAAKRVADSFGAAIFFRMGIQQLNQDLLEAAQKSLEIAAGLDPGNATIGEQLKVVKVLRREERPRKALLDAQKAFEQQDYDSARRLAESIPRDFSHYDNVRQLLAVVCFKLGEAAFRAKNLDEAIRCAERALAHDPQHATLTKNLADLRDFRARGGFAADDARNRGIEIANGVVEILNRIHETGQGITPDMARHLLAQLEEAVRLTGGSPSVVQLRDQLRNAVRGY